MRPRSLPTVAVAPRGFRDSAYSRLGWPRRLLRRRQHEGTATQCYTKTVTHREMLNNSGEILRAVSAGETVQVTNHGQVAAVISPPPGGSLP